ncbi:aminotransferase [Parasulfitobacter algicola]|uniref:aspartate transaminase n=1 Tax=Parasulfitobacter algicola TaxID=2614809 RepID=A0ABX2IYR6_9RHOB|nr:aminotransferase [Sulfitobacter algicola]NSX55678.1 aminotransferase [Sulfitobacter algicola]
MVSSTQMTFAPPVMAARQWLDGVTFPADRPLLNVSQAAPVDPPPAPMLAAMADMIADPDTHLYGPVLGLPELRAQVAQHWTRSYGGAVSDDQVAITSGCNQAFAATIAAIAQAGDAVMLPTPWYFNHKMWLDMAGVQALPLPTGPDLLPDPEQAAQLITDRTRAIALVTPNNPGGVEYPTDLIRAFYNLAQSRGLKLIIDETYRDFHSHIGPSHDLFTDPDWPQTLIQLYSFSKAYRLTGHRVGAMVTSTNLLAEAEKFLDTVTICPNQLGQKAALWGMQNLSQWLAGERAEILNRRAAITDHFPMLDQHGWQLLGCGAYFAYVRHPFDMPSDQLARHLVRDASILLLPGTMFQPDGNLDGKRQLRIAFANIDRDQIKMLFERLADLAPPAPLS